MATELYGERIGDNAIRFQRVLPGPIDRVWAYLTESDTRATWLAAGETELEPGGKVEMIFRNKDLSAQADDPPPAKYADMPDCVSFCGRVIECDPPQLLVHSWESSEENTEVRYELSEQADGKVLLTLTHTRLDDREERLGVAAGWHTHLDILVDVMDGREPQPFWREHTRLEAHYTSVV